MKFIQSRADIPELMDDPDSDQVKLINTVKQFKGINLLFSRSRRLIKTYILSQMTPERNIPYRFLDVGAGGCDIALWFYRYCLKKGIPVEITCLDNDPRIAAYAKEVTRNVPAIEVVEASIFDLSQQEPFDFAFSNHFLHHFPNDMVVKILDTLTRITTRGVLMNDLYRSRAAYIAYRIFAMVFLHNSFAAYDGSLSILRGFTHKEMTGIIAKTARPDVLEIKRAFPGRIILFSSLQIDENNGNPA